MGPTLDFLGATVTVLRVVDFRGGVGKERQQGSWTIRPEQGKPSIRTWSESLWMMHHMSIPWLHREGIWSPRPRSNLAHVPREVCNGI